MDELLRNLFLILFGGLAIGSLVGIVVFIVYRKSFATEKLEYYEDELNPSIREFLDKGRSN